mmetsp:Transcript_36202/g.57923  ORF Transcript_36202/g.57923 Transcript_36202/m.57923 type:complete len:96 (+) Transcript_36202:1278-1565(+)
MLAISTSYGRCVAFGASLPTIWCNPGLNFCKPAPSTNSQTKHHKTLPPSSSLVDHRKDRREQAAKKNLELNKAHERFREIVYRNSYKFQTKLRTK